MSSLCCYPCNYFVKACEKEMTFDSPKFLVKEVQIFPSLKKQNIPINAKCKLWLFTKHQKLFIWKWLCKLFWACNCILKNVLSCELAFIYNYNQQTVDCRYLLPFRLVDHKLVPDKFFFKFWKVVQGTVTLFTFKKIRTKRQQFALR